MSEVVRTEDRNGVLVTIYDNGMERANNRIIRPPVTTQITKENASEYHRARKDKQKKALDAALLAGVEDETIKKEYGEDAWIVAVGQSAMIKATTPDDPKAIEAARFIRDWHNELNSDGEADHNERIPARVVLLLAELTRRNDSEDVIDGVTSEE